MKVLFTIAFALQSALYPLVAEVLESKPAPVVQHKVQPPKDRSLQVVTSKGYKLCYAPTFSRYAAHYSYIGLVDCSSRRAIPARFDAFGRIGFNINKTWLCLTAPDSVWAREKTFDYLFLSPCVINLKAQQWKVQNGRFVSREAFYSIKDDGSYLYAAKPRDKKLFFHKLSSSMTEWSKTIAMPGNLSIFMWIGWDLIDRYGQQRYFLRSNYSDKNTMILYYNLMSGHIAEYYEPTGRLYCMYSDTRKQNWDWVWWALCDDTKPPKVNRAYFKPIPVGQNLYSFEDKDGNILRVTRYGYYWGVPYTVNKRYIAKDTGKSPTSAFVVDPYMEVWLRFIYANAGRNLHNCPAPGHWLGDPYKKKANIPPLPPSFNLSEQWIQRLFAIDYSTDMTTPASGICGVCLLQAYQMIAELLHFQTPLTSGGYFFDTAAGRNPFPSFQARNSILHQTLEDIMSYYNYPVTGRRDSFLRNVERAYASSISMLPQYDWTMLGQGVTQAEVDSLMQRVINSPAGSVFLFTMARFDPDLRTLTAHAVPVLRLQSGVVTIPANSLVTMEEYRARLVPANSVAELRERLGRFAGRHINVVGLGVFSVDRAYRNGFEGIVSLSDCSGDGSDRRGNGLLPLPELLNQCISGRCEY